MASYTYSPLLEGETIRVLTLLHDSESRPIHCQLHPRKNRDDFEYDALSYAWQGESQTSSINIISENTIFKLDVIPNLEAALRQLRNPDHDRFLWVDAICINQDSNEEKSQQVPKMAQIYSEAANVRIWLGKDDANKSAVAMEFIKRILDFDNFDRLIADDRLVKEWAALLSLMKRTWFGRRWVIQEVALARRAWLHCGREFITWDDFADAVRLFEERTETIEEHFIKAPDFGYRKDT